MEYQFSVAQLLRDDNGTVISCFGSNDPRYLFLFRTDWIQGCPDDARNAICEAFREPEYKVTMNSRENGYRSTDVTRPEKKTPLKLGNKSVAIKIEAMEEANMCTDITLLAYEKKIGHRLPMEIRMRLNNEISIIRELCSELSKNGWAPINVDYGDDQASVIGVENLIEQAIEVDECWIWFKKCNEIAGTVLMDSVKIIFGNGSYGWDLIADYGTSNPEFQSAVDKVVHWTMEQEQNEN